MRIRCSGNVFTESLPSNGFLLAAPFRIVRGPHRQQGDLISLLLFFKNKESRLKMYLRKIGCGGVDWIHLAQDKGPRRALVNTIMNPRGSTKC
jgi:hypothetical protein